MRIFLKVKFFCIIVSVFLLLLPLAAESQETAVSCIIVYSLKDIEPGSVLRKEMLSERKIAASHFPPDAAIGADTCVGRKTHCAISVGQIVSTFDLESPVSGNLAAPNDGQIEQAARAESQDNGHAKGRVVFTSKTIPADSIIKRGQLKIRTIEASRILLDAPSYKDMVVGRRVKRTLPANEQLCQHSLQPEPISPRADKN